MFRISFFAFLFFALEYVTCYDVSEGNPLRFNPINRSIVKNNNSRTVQKMKQSTKQKQRKKRFNHVVVSNFLQSYRGFDIFFQFNWKNESSIVNRLWKPLPSYGIESNFYCFLNSQAVYHSQRTCLINVGWITVKLDTTSSTNIV